MVGQIYPTELQLNKANYSDTEAPFLFIVTPIVGVCNCSMFCCALLYVHSSIAIILMGKRELVALLNLSSWCLVVVGRLFLPVPRGFLQFVIVVFPDHTHLLFLNLSIINGIVFLKFMINEMILIFKMVNFPFLDGDVPRSLSYGV